MMNDEPGGSPRPDRTPDLQELRKNLRKVYFFLFAIGMLVMLAVEIIYLSIGYISWVGFLVDFVIVTVVLTVVVLITYLLNRKIWLQAYDTANKLLTIEEISTDAVIAIDTDTAITAWSQGAEKVFGYSEDEALGQSIAIIAPDDFLERELPAMEKVVDEGCISMHRTVSRRRSGELFPVDVSVNLLHDPEGGLSGALAVLRDISREVETRRKLRESEERYRDLYESDLYGVVATDMQGNILECNEAYAAMLGYARDELTGMAFGELTPAEWQAVEKDIIENQVIPNGFSDEYEKEYTRKDGSLFPVSLRVRRRDDAEGNPIGMWAIVRDVSERKQYERFITDTIVRLDEANVKLEEADRLRRDFIAMVSHELRSPLQTIESSVNALRQHSPDSPPGVTNELVDILDRGLQRLSRLVDDLLDIACIETGQLRLKLTEGDLVELASRVVEAYQPFFSEKNIELRMDTACGACTVVYDPMRIEQVLVNLVDNALKFTESGVVTVSLDCSANRAVCSVTDSGPGIPAGIQDKIFDKFYSVDAPHEDNSRGVGLGLAISKGIVDAHGGSIWVESAIGKGSTVAFDLPRGEAPTGGRAR